MIAISLLAATVMSLPPDAATFIKHSLKVSTFGSATADLNGDGKLEVFVYDKDPEFCGSGGCTLFVISPHRGSYRIVMRSTVAQLPIWLLASSNRGWRDIGVTISGGGVTRAYTARMRFDGERYPSNPAIAPAVRVRPSGKLLISR